MDTEQAVAAAEVVIKEAEGAPLGERGQQRDSLASSTASGFLSTP